MTKTQILLRGSKKKEKTMNKEIKETTTFEISIKDMCLEYGVKIPHGFRGDEMVRVYHDEDGWHVGPAYPGEGIENLDDDKWAPYDDTMRENLRNRAMYKMRFKPRKHPVTKKAIHQVLDETDGKIRESARLINIPTSTFRYYLKRFGLTDHATRLRLFRKLIDLDIQTQNNIESILKHFQELSSRSRV
jgi:DNA-binding NtrC family response regulator